jgi:outer membrane protein assembly factor BamB
MKMALFLGHSNRMLGPRTTLASFCLLAFTFCLVLSAREQTADRYWPQWRGPHATGVSRNATPPVEWSEQKNIRWKIEIPGRGSATPVIWGDRVFVLSAVPVGVAAPSAHAPLGRSPVAHKYVVMALDRKTGKVVWERVAKEETPHEASHPENGTWASASAATDGDHVIASFESRGYFAYDMNGKLIWQKDLGDKRMRNTFGEGSTPALFGNYLVIVWDHQGQSFIVALDKRTGAELWRRERKEIDSWATPLVVTVNGRAQVVTGAMNQVVSYDLETGDVVWFTGGLTMNPIPTPVASDGMVFLTAGFRGNSLKAIRLAGAKGDITGTSAVAWTLDRDTPYVPSPMLYDELLYVLKSNNGILSAFDAKTGRAHYQAQRIDSLGEVFASPVGAAGRVYLPGREGTTVVLKHGPRLEVLAVNRLDDGFDASPALVDSEMYLRGYKNLYCIAEK